MLKEIVVRMAFRDLPDPEDRLENAVFLENLEWMDCRERSDPQDHRYVNNLDFIN